MWAENMCPDFVILLSIWGCKSSSVDTKAEMVILWYCWCLSAFLMMHCYLNEQFIICIVPLWILSDLIYFFLYYVLMMYMFCLMVFLIFGMNTVNYDGVLCSAYIKLESSPYGRVLWHMVVMVTNLTLPSSCCIIW